MEKFQQTDRNTAVKLLNDLILEKLDMMPDSGTLQYDILFRFSCGMEDVILGQELTSVIPTYVVYNFDLVQPVVNSRGFVDLDNPDCFHTPYYAEALFEYHARIAKLITYAEAILQKSTFPFAVLGADECVPNSGDADWEGKLVVLRADSLPPESRQADNQLVLCTGGLGSKPNAHDDDIVIQALHSEHEFVFSGSAVIGVADLSNPAIKAIYSLIRGEMPETGFTGGSRRSIISSDDIRDSLKQSFVANYENPEEGLRIWETLSDCIQLSDAFTVHEVDIAGNPII